MIYKLSKWIFYEKKGNILLVRLETNLKKTVLDNIDLKDVDKLLSFGEYGEICGVIDDEHLLVYRKGKTFIEHFGVLNIDRKEVKRKEELIYNSHYLEYRFMGSNKVLSVVWYEPYTAVRVYYNNGYDIIYARFFRFDFKPYSHWLNEPIKCYFSTNNLEKLTVTAFNRAENYIKIIKSAYDETSRRIQAIDKKQIVLENVKLRQFKEPPYCVTQSEMYLVYLSFISERKVSKKIDECEYEIVCVNTETGVSIKKLLKLESDEFIRIQPLNNNDDFIVYGDYACKFYHYKIEKSQLIDSVYTLYDVIKYNGVQVINDHLLVICSDKVVFVYDIFSMKEIYKIKSHYPYQLCITPNEKYMIIAESRSSYVISVYQLNNAKCVFELPINFCKTGKQSIWCTDKYLIVKLNENYDHGMMIFSLNNFV